MGHPVTCTVIETNPNGGGPVSLLQNGGLTMKMSFRQENTPTTGLSEMWQHLHTNRQFEEARELHLRHETSIQVHLLRLRLKTQIRPRFAHQNETWQRRDSTAFPQSGLTIP